MFNYKKMCKIKPLTLEIEKDVWSKFKSTLTKERTLNAAVVDLIKKEINKHERR